MLVWVIGQGGLLGSAVIRQLTGQKLHRLFASSQIPWGDLPAVREAFEDDAERFAGLASGQSWAVIWVAGRASVSSGAGETEIELASLGHLVEALKAHMPTGQGSFFLASSAGGVYAGSKEPPFSVNTIPHPLSAYGQLKRAQEQLVVSELGARCNVLVGRLSNIYGPGQDLGKLQGLVSALVRAAITRTPINMFVSLDTLRDYLFVDDAAAMIIDLVTRDTPTPIPESTILVLASGQAVPLGYLINLVQDIGRVRIPIALGAHASAASQSRDLRLIPTEGLDMHISTPLPAGVKNVYLDILARIQSAGTSI